MTTIAAARRNAQQQIRRKNAGLPWHGNPYNWTTDRRAHDHWAKWFLKGAARKVYGEFTHA